MNVKFVKERTNKRFSMFSTLTKRKLTDNQVANVFINAIDEYFQIDGINTSAFAATGHEVRTSLF